MKHLLLFTISFLLINLAQAQTVTYHVNSGPSFKAVNYSPAFAGANWNQPSYNDSGWIQAVNGGGLTPGGTCNGPNTCAFCTGDTIIWSSTASSPPDTSCFRKFFNFGPCGRITAATLSIGADDFFWAYVNGNFLDSTLLEDNGITTVFNANQLSWLHTGSSNLIAVEIDHPIPYCAEFVMAGTVTVDTTGCTTGISDLATNNISISPNPATHQINIAADQSDTYTLTMSDMIGNTVLSKRLNGKNITLDISDMEKGVYILHMLDTNGRATVRKITKE